MYDFFYSLKDLLLAIDEKVAIFAPSKRKKFLDDQ